MAAFCAIAAGAGSHAAARAGDETPRARLRVFMVMVASLTALVFIGI